MFLDQILQTSLLKDFKLILHRAVHDIYSTLDLMVESFCTVPTADAHMYCSSSLFLYTSSFLVIPMPESSIPRLELVLSEQNEGVWLVLNLFRIGGQLTQEDHMLDVSIECQVNSDWQ